MYVVSLYRFFFYIEILLVRLNICQRRMRRFLHYLAKLAGQHERTFSFDKRRLYLQYIAANLRPCKPVRKADLVLFFFCAVLVFPRPEVFLEYRFINHPFVILAMPHHLARNLSAHLRNYPLKAADASLPGVMTDGKEHHLF